MWFQIPQYCTIQETNISPQIGILKMIFPFPKVGYVNPLEGNPKFNMIQTFLSADSSSSRKNGEGIFTKLSSLPSFWVRVAIIDYLVVGGFKYFFYVHPYLGKWSNMTNIFQMGWNHQL